MSAAVLRLALFSSVLFTLVGCGATTCDRLNAAQTTFFAGKTECKSTNGSSTVTLTKASTCNDTSKCSAADVKVLETYIDCLGKAPACTSGKEADATSAGMACAFAAASGLSTDCQSTLK